MNESPELLLRTTLIRLTTGLQLRRFEPGQSEVSVEVLAAEALMVQENVQAVENVPAAPTFSA